MSRPDLSPEARAAFARRQNWRAVKRWAGDIVAPMFVALGVLMVVVYVLVRVARLAWGSP